MTFSQKIENAYVLDTVALIRHLTEHRKLGNYAKAVFSAAEQGRTQLIVSPIVLAEMYYADKKHNLFENFLQVYDEINAQPQFQLVIITSNDMRDFMLNEAVPEMHDRIIAGLARKLGVPLVTNDPSIHSSGIVEIVW